jgi:hypothetical protein
MNDELIQELQSILNKMDKSDNRDIKVLVATIGVLIGAYKDGMIEDFGLLFIGLGSKL